MLIYFFNSLLEQNEQKGLLVSQGLINVQIPLFYYSKTQEQEL